MTMILAPNFGGPIATVSDANWASVVQLAHFRGSNTSTTFTNQAVGRGNTLLSIGGASLSTTKSKWGPSSFRGNVSGVYAQSNGVTDYNFGTGDWTVEFWINPDSLSRGPDGSKIYFDMRDTSNTAAFVPTITSPDDLGSIRLITNGIARITSSTGAITAVAWQHIACARVSNNTRLFVNGTQVGSTFSDANTYVQAGKLTLNGAGNGAGNTAVYYQDLRITKGVGRYSANFTAPAAQFPNV